MCTYVCVHVCVCVYAKACFLSTSTWETDLHTLVEQLEDSWVADQTVYVLLQALSQPTQQVQSNNHEVFIWWVILFWLRQVGLQAPFNITLTGTSWSKLIMDPLMLKNTTTTNKKTNNKKQSKKKKDKRREEQMLKLSIFAILTALLHSYLPYVIKHHEHLSRFMQLYNRMNAQEF